MDEWLLGGRKNITDEKCGIKRRVWREVKLMWETALIPSVLTRVGAFGILLATQSFLGHISEFDISAFGLVQTTLIRFIHGTLIGITSSETDHTAKGDSSFQRSKKCDILTAAMTVPFLVFGAALLLGEQENSDGLVARLYLSCIPFLHYMVFNLTIQMFLQPPRFPDRGNAILVWLSVFSFALHHLLSWLFVDKLGWGTVGSLVTTNIALWASGIGQFLYFYGGWFAIDKSDDSSSLAALDVWAIVKFSVSSGIMLCSDLWYNSNIQLLLAVYMNDVTAASISAFSICLNICSWEFMICLGFLSCACIRVSNEMARGNTKAAKFCIRVILSISVLVGVFLCILCLVFRRKISYFFSEEDLHVADAVSDLSTLLAFSILLKSINPVFSGVAIGAGLQGMVAIVNICCYYGIGIPLGALLACVAHLQVKGLWIGILFGELAQLLILIIFLIRKIDWQD